MARDHIEHLEFEVNMAAKMACQLLVSASEPGITPARRHHLIKRATVVQETGARKQQQLAIKVRDRHMMDAAILESMKGGISRRFCWANKGGSHV